MDEQPAMFQQIESFEPAIEESKNLSNPQQSMKTMPSTPKPEFKQFIAGFNSDGFWTVQKRAFLESCIDGNEFDDDEVRAALGSMTLTVDTDIVYMTLLGWFILRETFIDDEDSWQLIA